MATMEKLKGSMVKLTFDITQSELEAGMQKAYVKNARKYNVPGFRKGKAPRKVIESMYGGLAFFDDAFDDIYPAMFEAAVKEYGLDTIATPHVDIDALRGFGDTELPEGIAVRFTATVAVRPEVKLGEYKGIEVTADEYTVTDEAVDKRIEAQRSDMARLIAVERPIEKGDVIDLNYSGSIDGVKFDGGTADNQELEIGSGRFIPGFEEQLIGMSVGEDKNITVTFPTEYHAAELAGKEAVFACHINDIRVKELPELNDDFAKDVSEYNTFEEYKASVRSEMEKQSEELRKNAFENAALLAAANNAEIEIPDVMIEAECDDMIHDLEYRLAGQGLTLDMYTQFSGMTVEQMKKDYVPDATNRVRIRLMLDAIIKEENIVPTVEDVDNAANEFLSSIKDEAQRKEFKVTDELKRYFENRVKVEKAVALIVGNAVRK